MPEHPPAGGPRAVLLAAGRGTRLRPLTDTLPKPLLPLGSGPVLTQNLAWLAAAGIALLGINLHHHGDAIRNAVLQSGAFGMTIAYSEEAELLGTAGGTRRAEALLLPRSWPLLVVYGDNLVRIDLKQMSGVHAAGGGIATIALHRVPDVRGSGLIRFDRRGRIQSFLEKPKTEGRRAGWVNAGVYLLEAGAVEAIPADGPSDFGYDVFPRLLAEGEKLRAYCLSKEESVFAIDTPERYREAAGAVEDRTR